MWGLPGHHHCLGERAQVRPGETSLELILEWVPNRLFLMRWLTWENENQKCWRPYFRKTCLEMMPRPRKAEPTDGENLIPNSTVVVPRSSQTWNHVTKASIIFPPLFKAVLVGLLITTYPKSSDVLDPGLLLMWTEPLLLYLFWFN